MERSSLLLLSLLIRVALLCGAFASLWFLELARVWQAIAPVLIAILVLSFWVAYDATNLIAATRHKLPDESDALCRVVSQ